MRRRASARAEADDRAAGDEVATALAGTPWSVRRARGPGLELYEAGNLADIIVATQVGWRTLRGARRSGHGGQALALAWGRLPADGRLVTVEFTAGRLRPRTTPARVIEIAGLAWFAVTAGRFIAVSAATHEGSERLRLQAGSLR
jgi:hypothetical protein